MYFITLHIECQINKISLIQSYFEFFFCQLRYFLRFQFNIETQILIVDKPRYVTRPSKQVAVGGSTVNIDCESDGNPPPSVTWTKDGAHISPHIKHEVHLNGTLSIFDFKKDSGEGYYQCTIENVIGKSSAGAAITFVNENGE